VYRLNEKGSKGLEIFFKRRGVGNYWHMEVIASGIFVELGCLRDSSRTSYRTIA
jgi:hypothetical protein